MIRFSCVGQETVIRKTKYNNKQGVCMLKKPIDIPTTKKVREYVDIPVIYTVIDKSRPLQPYIDAGVNIMKFIVTMKDSQGKEFPYAINGASDIFEADQRASKIAESYGWQNIAIRDSKEN